MIDNRHIHPRDSIMIAAYPTYKGADLVYYQAAIDLTLIAR